jgi:hypothetical protein
MSIGGTPPKSDQLLSQLRGLRQQGLGDCQLTLGPSGRASAKTLFDRFCDFFTSKPSSPKQGDALQKLQAILEQDYGSVGKQVLSSLVGNKKPITVKEAIKQIKLAKGQFQQWQQQAVQSAVENKFANDRRQVFIQQVLPQMIQTLKLEGIAQVKVLQDLIMCAQDIEEIWNLAHEAIGHPEDIKKYLSYAATLSPESRSQAHSDLLLNIDQRTAIGQMHQLLRLESGQAQVLHDLINTSSPKEIFAFVHATQSNQKAAYDLLLNLSKLPQDLRPELLSSLSNFAGRNLVEAQRLGSAFAKMVELLQPNTEQKQVLLELIRHINIQENPKAVLAFAYAAINNPEGAGKFLSSLSGLTKDEQLNAFSNLFEKGQISFTQCTRCFYKLSSTDPMADAANQIHNAMQLNPATDGLTHATQGAAEIAKHLITASGQLADESFIFGLKTILEEGKALPGINNTFLAQQLDRLLSDKGLQAQLMNIGRNGISPVAHQAIRETLGLPPGAPITAKEARQAALAALLTPLRQGEVGSCGVTSAAINVHDTRPSEMLRDMASLIEKGYLERQNGYARVQVPFNQSIFKSPTQGKAILGNAGGQMMPVGQKRAITGNPLLRCWEYTLATSGESQLCSERNQHLWSLAGQVLDPTSAYHFMQCTRFAFDASKVITSSIDGHSSRGAFALTYTSPRSDQKFEIQTAEQLHQALQEFSGRPLVVGPQFESEASRLLENLGGLYTRSVLRAQYGLQNIHEIMVPTFQDLPDALLDIAGKVASEARRSGVPMPSYAPMGNQGHAFNIRLNDPILQAGIRTGAWESPEKRQAFLRQQLMEPMLAKTLDPNNTQSNAEIRDFFNDLKNHLASTLNIPSWVIQQALDRIELQGKYSYADLAKAAYQALQREFPHISQTTLSENIMMALAPRCPQMMFADTNWEDDGKPIHWGIQFNPITEQFGIVQGIQNDSSKYDFMPSSMSESKFDECQIIDDPRVLFRPQ